MITVKDLAGLGFESNRTTAIIGVDLWRVNDYYSLPVQVQAQLDKAMRLTSVSMDKIEPIVPADYFGGLLLHDLANEDIFKDDGESFLPKWLPLRMVRDLAEGKNVRIKFRDKQDFELTLVGTSASLEDVDFCAKSFKTTEIARELQTRG